MISISRLYCQHQEASDRLRYVRPHGAKDARRPIVVWNCTRRCNLSCAHCYSSSGQASSDETMSAAHAKAMIDDLVRYRAPVLLFSGGEPLMRPDVLELVAYASAAGMRTVLSTNGTLISAKVAAELARAKLAYAGVSLDGLGKTNDAFRGRDGAFAAALMGIRNCQAAGVRVGLRLTMTRRNVADIPGVFELIERDNIDRVCFYHLVSSGRGAELGADTLSHGDIRRTLDMIIDQTAAWHAAGRKAQVLTVDNHADGPYLYMRMCREAAAGETPAGHEGKMPSPQHMGKMPSPQHMGETPMPLTGKTSSSRAAAMELLRANGGNASGQAIACVSWNGDVLPDQFWRQHVLGNVTSRPFSEIWSDESIPLLAELRGRKGRLKGRCRRCRFLDICNGNFRARAEAAGNMWGDDPACYLTDEEISIA